MENDITQPLIADKSVGSIDLPISDSSPNTLNTKDTIDLFTPRLM